MRRLKTMDDIKLDGKTVILRVDFNVSVGDDGVVDEFEDYRIEAAIPTIKELQKKRCKIVLLTHFGRPGEGEGDYSLGPIHVRLEQLLKDDVKLLNEMTGAAVEAVIAGMRKGDIVLLPNVRIDPRETEPSESFAKELALFGEAYINEAFSVSHRNHTSMALLPTMMESCAGRRTVEEYEVISKLSSSPERPYVAIVSGAKVHTKVNMLRKLLEQVDTLCVGGVLANMFLANQGKAPRKSFTYEDMKMTEELWDKAHDKIVIPQDVVIGSIDGDVTGREVVSITTALSSAVGVWDVGPRTVADFLRRCETARTISWNGPIGMFEVPAYSEGSVSLAQGLSELDAYKVVGGGDTVKLLEQVHLRSKFDHVSVGGGAMVSLMEGSAMPALESLFIDE